MLFKKGNIPWNIGKTSWSKGKKLSKEHKERIGLANSISQKGKIISEVTKRKMSIAQMKRKDVRGGWKLSSVNRRNIGIAVKIRFDKKGRKKYKRYIHIRDDKYISWRNKVFKRDDYTCQKCRKNRCYLEAHHIKSWAHYPKSRYVIRNGLTLCKKCHELTDNYKNKKSEKRVTRIY